MRSRLPDLVRYLLAGSLSDRQIAAAVETSKTTVARYRGLLATTPLLPENLRDLDGAALWRMFNSERRTSGKHIPDFTEAQPRLREPGMTIYRLWQEYRLEAGERGLSYPQYARRFAGHRGTRAVSMRRQHEPGYAVYVDFSGKRPHYIDRSSGQQVPVELFVAVLGASSYLYVQCTATQSVPDWIDAHTRMVEFFGGVPLVVVPDNLKAAIVKTGAEPTIQRHYLEWARHYRAAILPARPGQPRDKGIVEGAVRFVQQQVLPEISKQRYFSLDQLNDAVSQLLAVMNSRPFQKRDGNRLTEFERLDRPALQPMPSERHIYRQWVAKQTVPSDYHISIHGHFYSVPHTLVGCKVEACICPPFVEVHYEGKRVARHLRQAARGQHTTDPDHQHEAHRAMGDRTPESLLTWAAKVGPNMKQLMRKQFAGKVALQGLPAAVSIRNLEQLANQEQLEEAAQRALTLRSCSPSAVRRLLIERQSRIVPDATAASSKSLSLRASQGAGRRRSSFSRALP